ncbi:hypothetical protein ES332_A12G222300v1 [Gossypium tomentosum]|uniref:Uncharacterized protein n=1 Tax=Gossypium tomentosum TaxID=34277 RepID=A0A5D2N1C2_GOSTO|nr:hypothetical protein ES332_A12G222300v1 [Gossypium tomentosum]
MSRSSRIKSFSGLRVSNSLDNMVRFGQDSTSKVAISISSQRGRGSRCVAKALFSNFTEKSIKVVILAQAEARRLSHNFFGFFYQKNYISSNYQKINQFNPLLPKILQVYGTYTS